MTKPKDAATGMKRKLLISIVILAAPLSIWAAAQLIPGVSDFAVFAAGIVVPIGFVMLVLYFVRAIAKENEVNRIASRSSKRQCVSCCYALRGNVSGVCPECGTKMETKSSGY